MDLPSLVNLIVEKLGGNRVEFIRLIEGDYDVYVEFVHAGNHYDARVAVDVIPPHIEVLEVKSDQGPLQDTDYSRWIEGVINGMTRNDAGELVDSTSQQ